MILPHRRIGNILGTRRREHQLMLERIPIRYLLAEIEAIQWLALDLSNVPGDSRAVADIQREEQVTEAKRQALTPRMRPVVGLGKATSLIKRLGQEGLSYLIERDGFGRWKVRTTRRRWKVLCFLDMEVQTGTTIGDEAT